MKLGKALTSGNDTVVLATPGKKWYICGMGKHCELGGQKLTIAVQSLAPTASPAPSPLYAKPYETKSYEDKSKLCKRNKRCRSKRVPTLGIALQNTVNFGTTFIFHYVVGAHNVFRVNGTGFQYCVNPPANEALSTGHDIVVLRTPGRKWYICGVGNHCENGLKLFIVVKPAETKAPITKGKEIIVGDEARWRLGFDYQAWAKDKDFRVGDKLVFKYPIGVHNVFRVNGTGF
ncbi:unnamed protein product [Dovyalis caffra]|uniref:Phytocyanin domain-containing protein n=1 Tax=Dovyalis caffra TaxID=77055 RepID=A0AAV1RX22_9ROSI|nr:unnamed protein product [Dovyalis caffra]